MKLITPYWLQVCFQKKIPSGTLNLAVLNICFVMHTLPQDGGKYEIIEATNMAN